MFSRPTYLVPDSCFDVGYFDERAPEYVEMLAYVKANRVNSSFFSLFKGCYVSARLDVVRNSGAQLVPICAPHMISGCASEVHKREVYPSHLDELFRKYKSLKFVSNVYYTMYAFSLVKKKLTPSIEKFLIENMGVSLFNSVHELNGHRGKSLSVEPYIASIEAVDDMFYPFPTVKVSTDIVEICDVVGLELYTQNDFRGFDHIDGVAFCADVIKMPKQVSSIDVNSLNSVEIVRLRESIVGMGFENLNLAVSWSEMIGIVSSDVSFSALGARIEDVARDRRRIVPDIQRLVKDVGCSEYIVYVGRKGSRYEEVQKKFHTVVHAMSNGSMYDNDDRRMIISNGIGILVLDWSWSEMADPCVSVLALREYISSDTCVLVYGPDDVFELFSHYVLLSHYGHNHFSECFNHCNDSIGRRLKDLRFVSVCLSGGTCYWKFDSAPSSRIEIIGQTSVVIQSQSRIDIYLKGYSDHEMIEFLRSFRAIGIYFNIHFMGACVGTTWFYFRLFCMFELRREFSVLDERFVHMPRFDLYRVMNGQDFQDPFYQVEKPNGFEVSLWDQMFDRNDDFWIYHPPSRNPSFQEHG